MADYVPAQGDLISVAMGSQSGHEQKGYRPALVVSKEVFNRNTGQVIVCPVTSTDRRYPFHVRVPDALDIAGYVMVEQVRSIDYRSRKAKRLDAASEEFLADVLAILDACIY